MRLHVRVFGAEERLGAVDRERFGNVDELTAAVVALAWIAFRVLVREYRAGSLEYGTADEIFGRDQLQAVDLPLLLVAHGLRDFRIGVRECRAQIYECRAQLKLSTTGACGSVCFRRHGFSISAICSTRFWCRPPSN